MILYLDTTERDSFRVALIDNGKVIKDKTVLSARQHSEKLLRTIDNLLSRFPKPHPTPPLSKGRGLKGIAVVKGPGSFTSLRIGISTANALSFAWGVPAVGISPSYDLKQLGRFFKKKTAKIVLPEYGREPHITLKH